MLREELLVAGARDGSTLDEYVRLYEDDSGNERHGFWPFYGKPGYVRYLSFEGHTRAHELACLLFDGELLRDAKTSLKLFVNANASRLGEIETKRLYTLCGNVKKKYKKGSRSGTIVVTDGTTNKMIKKDEAVPDGWYVGRTVTKKWKRADRKPKFKYDIYDVSFIETFYRAERISTYDDLVEFFSKYDEEFYEKRSIYYEEHHVVPAFETGGVETSETVPLPLYFHFRAHLLRAREHVDRVLADKNYASAAMCLYQPYVPKAVRDDIFEYFADDVAEARAGRTRCSKTASALGKFSESMKRYHAGKKRNVLVDKFHDSARSKRPVVDLVSGATYADTRAAAAATGCPTKTISACCNGSFFRCKGYVWRYYEGEEVNYGEKLKEDLETYAKDHPRSYAYVTVEDIRSGR